MIYTLIPIGLIAVFVIYVLYQLIVKKDVKQIRTVLLPGVLFIAIWVAIYWFWLK